MQEELKTESRSIYAPASLGSALVQCAIRTKWVLVDQMALGLELW
jgi:hypothetical protein